MDMHTPILLICLAATGLTFALIYRQATSEPSRLLGNVKASLWGEYEDHYHNNSDEPMLNLDKDPVLSKHGAANWLSSLK